MSDSPTFETAALEFSVFGGERLGTWSRDGFRLDLYDLHQNAVSGRPLLGYEFFDEQFGSEPVFQGDSFSPSPLCALDSDATAAALLSFLALRPGDTDAEYFSSYTPAQLEWCQRRGEELSWFAEELRQRHEWRQQVDEEDTDQAVLTIARLGTRHDLFELLDLDIFAAYALVEELALRTEDQDVCRLVRELHRARNEEVRGEW